METAKTIIPIDLIEDIARVTNLYEELQEGITHPQEYNSKLIMTLEELKNKLEP